MSPADGSNDRDHDDHEPFSTQGVDSERLSNKNPLGLEQYVDDKDDQAVLMTYSEESESF